MDKFGKALSEAFVEFESFDLATTALRFKSQGLIKGAKVKVVFSNQTELMSALFPTWAKSGRLGSSYSPKITRKAEELPGFYLSREEITGILSFTRAKVNLVRKLCDRPFENVFFRIT